MDSERPHRTGSTSSTSSELFICFTSRLSSSSSMKISSKSILSPGRARDPPISLSTSLSRRLRSNGSMKGGQASPMFPTGGKKRGCAFENPEPSSPKVTCIGQVRVKTKKQGKKMRTLSQRRSGEVSFRKVEQAREGVSQNQNQNLTQTNASNQYQQHQPECLPHRNQRWVHLPLTICEALRAFGSEFSCLFPCRSSCFSTSEREKEEKTAGSSEGSSAGQSSCGAVFGRWLVALHDGEEGKGREIELVVGGEEERTERPVRNSRRHVLDEMEIKDERREEKDEVVEEDEARVSICIPPKNALLLMRCRSDPMKMAALANRFWESPAPKDYEEENDHKEDDEEDEDVVDEEQEEDVKESHQVEDVVEMGQKEDENWVSVEINAEQENPEEETNLEMDVQDNIEEEKKEKLQITEELQAEAELENQEEETEVKQSVLLEEEEENDQLSGSSSEALVDRENKEDKEDPIREEESRVSSSSYSVQSDEEEGEPEEEEEESLAEEAALEKEGEKSTVEKETQLRHLENEEETVTQERSEPVETTHKEEEGEGGTKSEGRWRQRERESDSESHPVVGRESDQVKNQRKESSVLPDCLLLMMCEPKLSMEVSKETWVCSTDFIRWQPERDKQVVNPIDGTDEPKKRVSTDSESNPALHHQPLQQPPRSSCSLPTGAGVAMATMIEQKLVNAVAYEPFVLTRCKSEPMRTAAKLAPEACFWKNRKLEPHRRAPFGVGATGVGF